MRFGIAVFPADFAADPATIGRLVEERRFESLFFPEHTHIPASRRTPYPPGGELPREYSRTYDPFVALAAAAASTEKLLIATGICLVIERDAIITAKEVASVDRLSGGRLLFGVGAGWNIEEMENHGTDPSRRFSLMRERIEAMKAIWTEDEASYHGEHVDFDSIWCWPKPIQKPHPPVLVGGNGERVLDRVVAFGDEWMPNRASGLRERIEAMKAIWTEDDASYHGELVDFDPIWCWPKPIQKPHPPVLVGGNGERVLDRVVAFGDEWMPNRASGLGERIEELNRLAEEGGRDPIPVTLSGAKPDRELIERGEQAGVHRCVFYIPSSDRGGTERALDELAAAIGLG